MDIKNINPFLKSFNTVMPQLGFEVERKSLHIKSDIKGSGIAITVGVTGSIKGNVIYFMSEDGGKEIASQMMGGMEVSTLGEIEQSAISELANMLTANAGTNYSEENIIIDISTPVLFKGNDIIINVNTNEIICIEMQANKTIVEINIAIER